MREKNSPEDDIKVALLKRAKGYNYNEIINEYSLAENGEYVLSKKKVTKKYVPPDITSAKLYLELTGNLEGDYSSWSDDELLSEKQRLENLILENGDDSEDC